MTHKDRWLLLFVLFIRPEVRQCVELLGKEKFCKYGEIKKKREGMMGGGWQIRRTWRWVGALRQANWPLFRQTHSWRRPNQGTASRSHCLVCSNQATDRLFLAHSQQDHCLGFMARAQIIHKDAWSLRFYISQRISFFFFYSQQLCLQRLCHLYCVTNICNKTSFELNTENSLNQVRADCSGTFHFLKSGQEVDLFDKVCTPTAFVPRS